MRLIPPFAQRPVEGIAWLTDWEWPFEGGYTLLSKFSWANSAGAGDLCRAVFGRKLLLANNVGRHGRSLLDMGWVGAGGDAGIAHLRDKAVEGALVSRAGRWTHFIASDSAFRYCRTCLAHGYQSALYQIDGIAACPIHQEPLQSRCAHCQAAGARYAITDAGFDTPFHCPACMEPLAHSFRPSAWEDAALRHAAYTTLAPIAAWLQQLAATTLNWHEWDQWHFPLRWHCSEEERRAAAFRVLLQVHPLPPGITIPRSTARAPRIYLGSLSGTTAIGSSYDNDADHEQVALQRIKLYKAVRRFLSRRLRGCPEVAIRHLPSQIDVSAVDGAMQLSTTVCPRAQALALWRVHFETMQRESTSLSLRPAVLYWPAGIAIDDAAWAAFCLASFHAAVDAFDAWRQQALTLHDADLLGQDRPGARALHARFAPLLTPLILPTFPAVTSLTFTDEKGSKRIAIIGPPASALQMDRKIERGPWCKCDGYRQAHGCGAEVSQGGAQPAHVAQAAQPAGDEVDLAYFLPMEQLCLPPTLDGSVSTHDRHEWPCLCNASNDFDAVTLWLGHCKNVVTRRAYAREVEKALVWCVAQRGIALSHMSRDDADAFTDFLASPSPRDVWLPSHTPGAPRRWSPFRKIPSDRTRFRTIAIICALFNYWASQGFIASNPWSTSKWVSQMAQRRMAEMRAIPRHETLLTVEEWAFLAGAAGPTDENVATCIVLFLAYYASLKRTEITAIQLKHIHRSRAAKLGVDIWSIEIPERGEQSRRVYLLPSVIALLTSILTVDIEGFDALVAHGPNTYLLDMLGLAFCARRSDHACAPSAEAMSSWLNPVFQRAAQLAERSGDIVAAQRLGAASPFWLAAALETHIRGFEKSSQHCWTALGACEYCPPALIQYLPDRRELEVERIVDSLNGISAALHRCRIQRPA